VPPDYVPNLDDIIEAVGKGYTWTRYSEDQTYALIRRVIGRIAITNYDQAGLSNEERRQLHEEAKRCPRNFIFVDIRPDYPGGEYPWYGRIKLRSFSAILRFLARGIAEEPEFHVEKDPRTGPVLSNPPRTLEIEETTARPSNAAFAVEAHGLWYSIRYPKDGEGALNTWNQEAFGVLHDLFQMTVTDIAQVPLPSVTIAK